jgi:hypothetical protein
MSCQFPFRIFLPAITLLFYSIPSFAQKSPENKRALPVVCLSETEQLLYRQINNYRSEKGLKPVPLSASLTYVAQMHVRDLAEYGKITFRCNLHSWSDKGPWTGCCYTEDHRHASCMWNKPRELTNYNSEGYEIAYWTDEELNPSEFADKAVKAWKRSPDHNEVIINIREWKRMDWNAIGIGYYHGYAAVWFGTLPDPPNDVRLCAQ